MPRAEEEREALEKRQWESPQLSELGPLGEIVQVNRRKSGDCNDGIGFNESRRKFGDDDACGKGDEDDEDG